ncbi:AraC family transcriptional regulator [Chryseobacterium gallinarum]|uniref:AraC family transcriptional regulator n=1 Tax=Chryseobacterium gallinarum TaxID=1324352 RepID=UPI00202465D3|nr:response regulator transcription factor [Chryseobacterium gallinarum]MCL8538625.1 AraC family transcriptional regulator [Chryseobacterium gallinarum]
MKQSNQLPAKVPDDAVGYRQISGIDNYNKTTGCSYFLVVLFIEGSGIHYVDEKQFPIHKNQLHFLFPGQHHHWVTGPETFAHKVVVGHKLFETFSSTDEFTFIRHNLNPVFKLSESITQVVKAEMEGFNRDLGLCSEDESWKNIIQLRMDILASMMKREAENYINDTLLPRSNTIIKKYWDLINAHYVDHKPISWYAEKLAVTPNYLNILCKKHTNMTATDMIHNKIIQEAKQQLRFTNDSIKVITSNLGFDNSGAFSAFFKKKTNFSPSEYRS